MKNYKDLLKKLTPMNRVHIGEETRKAYKILKKFYPKSKYLRFSSYEKYNYWEIPPEWEVDYARLIDEDGQVIVDYKRDGFLSLFSYSPSFHGKVRLHELNKHLFSNPLLPDAYPFYFRNMYNFRNAVWGFSIPYNKRKNLKKCEYSVEIKTSFKKSELEMLEDTVHGKLKDSILMVGHFDHPAQCADGLMGCIAAHEIIKRLRQKEKTKLTYRALSTIEIIGSVFYSKFVKKKKIKEGLVTALSGIKGPLVFAKSLNENSYIDRVFSHLLSYIKKTKVVGFRDAVGNDEIAFDVHGVNVKCSSLMRWPYKYYHSDLDNFDKFNESSFENYIDIIMKAIHVIENNYIIKLNIKGLPKLASKELSLYISPDSMSGMIQESNELEKKINKIYTNNNKKNNDLKKLNKLMILLPGLANGKNTILDVSERCSLPFELVEIYINLWTEKKLLKKIWKNPLVSK